MRFRVQVSVLSFGLYLDSKAGSAGTHSGPSCIWKQVDGIIFMTPLNL